MEAVIRKLSELDPVWVYCAVASIAYLENVFPPFPSDVVIVAAGSIAGFGRVQFASILLAATAGSTLGFVTMYKVGDWFGASILAKGRMRFLPTAQVHVVESWFRRYGYWIITANRFLTGTRAVVSLFAGMSELPLGRTTLLSFVSALAWNFILVFAGKKLGENWRDIGVYLDAYGEAITGLLLVAVLFFVARKMLKSRTPRP